MIWRIFKGIVSGAIDFLKKIINGSGAARQVVVAAAVLAMVFANLLPGEGKGHDMYNTYYTAFTPAVFTFAIWGPIFVGLLAFALYQALPAKREDSRLDALALPVIVACFFTMLTPFTSIGISNIVIMIILAALFLAFRTAALQASQDRQYFWLVRLPVTIFFSWITVAAILNGFQWLCSLGLRSFGPEGIIAASFAIVAVALAGIYITVNYRDALYGFVLIWAFIGIIAAHPSAGLIAWSASLSTIALLLAIFWRYFPRQPAAPALENEAA